jgi:hypothetical protein
MVAGELLVPPINNKSIVINSGGRGYTKHN